MSTLRKCGGEHCTKMILLAPTAEGKYVPLDVSAPVYFLEGGIARRAVNYYVLHHATCPDANRFSRSRKEKTP